MKKTFYLISIVLLCSAALNAQNRKLKLPVDFSQVNDSLAMSRYEICYGEWVSFLKHFLVNGDSVEFISHLPDKSDRNKQIFYGKNMLGDKVKRSDPDFLLPVTGISFSQAQDYCEYLNEIEYGASVAKSIKLSYRLATSAEYDEALTKGWDSDVLYPITKTGRNEKGCMLINFKTVPTCANDSIAFSHMKQRALNVDTFWPDRLGNYHLRGNVAEMTSVEGLASGGSYQNDILECQPGIIIHYQKPEQWLGFRVVADILKQ